MAAWRDTAPRWIGLAVGLVLAAGLVLSWRLPASGGPLPAQMRILATPAGELAVSPAGVFVRGDRLRPGRPGAAGTVTVTNITGEPLALGVRLTPSSPALDRALRVRLSADGRERAAGRLGSLRSWTEGVVVLGAGESTRLRARVDLTAGPAAVEAGGQIVETTMELRGRAPGGGT